MVAMAESPVRTGRSCGAVASVYGSYIDELLCMVKANGDRFFYSTNDLYSVYALTDQAGTVVERYMYDPYGKVTVLDGNGTPRAGNQSAYGNTRFHQGLRLDTETGLYYNRARMFDPMLGRFLQRDPIGYEGGINLYAYCGNIPNIYVDPSGEWFWGCFAGIAGGLAVSFITGSEYTATDMVIDCALGVVSGGLSAINKVRKAAKCTKLLGKAERVVKETRTVTTQTLRTVNNGSRNAVKEWVVERKIKQEINHNFKIAVQSVLWDGSVKKGVMSFSAGSVREFTTTTLENNFANDEEITTTQTADVQMMVDPDNYLLGGTESESTTRGGRPSNPEGRQPTPDELKNAKTPEEYENMTPQERDDWVNGR